MKYRKNYIKLPLIVFLSILFIRILLIVSIWISISEIERKYVEKYPTPWPFIFTVQTKAILICTLITMVTLIIYYVLRHRYINIFYSRIHVWLSFISLVIVPFLSSFYQVTTPNGTVSDSVRIGNVIVYPFSSVLSILLFIIAIIFFILTIIKSSTSPKEPEQTDETASFLNEFID